MQALWSAVYYADMHHLENSEDKEDQRVWQSFSNGDFSCQKSDNPGTAIGRDHTEEQDNKKIKNRIKGITMNQNCDLFARCALIQGKRNIET